MIIRRARPDDSAGIAAVHVDAWRSAYAGILPDAYLARMSLPRQAAGYHAGILSGAAVHVAASPGVVGFATAGRPRSPGLGEGEIQTLYVLDDWRDQGVGRGLLGACAADLHASGCRSVFLWVLRDNPSRWFYQHLGGRAVMESTVQVAGVPVLQVAFLWDSIQTLRNQQPPSPRG